MSDFPKEAFAKGTGAQSDSESDGDEDIPAHSGLGKVGKTASV